MHATFEWEEAMAEGPEDMADEEFVGIEDGTDAPNASDPDAYASAKSKAGRKQASINSARARTSDARPGIFANTNIDARFAWLAHKDKIRDSEPASLAFAKHTLPRDKIMSLSRTEGMDTTEQKVAAFASARFIFEDEVRKRAAIPDSPASEPGVYRDLSPEDRTVYEALLSLHWGWALKYITMLSYGKRLWMDSLPSMEVLLTSDELAFLLASYPSAVDGLLEYDRPDGSKGLTGGFEPLRSPLNNLPTK